MRGKIELFGLDTLVNMAVAAGLHVEMRGAERREPFHPALGRAFPAPGTASRAAAIRPPVDDSETATVSPRSFNRTPTVSAMEASVAMPPSSLALDSTVAMSVVARQILAYAHPWSGL